MNNFTESEKEILILALMAIYMRPDKLNPRSRLFISDIEAVADKLGILPQLTERLNDLNDITG